jgi:hypothetical protein
VREYIQCRHVSSEHLCVAARMGWNEGTGGRRIMQLRSEARCVNRRGNFRLITRVSYNVQRIYIKALLKHKEYDRKEWMKWA